MFQDIVAVAAQNPTSQQLGEQVEQLLKQHKVLQWWENTTNPTKFNKDEQEVINAVKNGWKFYWVDGAIWYWENDIQDGNGPWAMEGNKGKNLRMVSARMINKLKMCGQFPKNYKFSR